MGTRSSFLLVYSLVSVILIKRKLKDACLVKNNIFKAYNLKTAFVFGLIKPKIYLSTGLNADEISCILLHEKAHIQRKDHIVKAIAFIILSVHWFNPFVWIAFLLMNTDMELSCDERVLKKMDEDIKKLYAKTLLSLASDRYILSGSPLAFGEGNIEERIKNVLNYKQPKMGVVAISTILAVVIAVGLIINPALATGVSKDDDIYSLANTWAQALKDRDGKARYQLIIPEEKEEYYQSLVSQNGEEQPWSIGVSSPYVVSYKINVDHTNTVITYIAETSSGEKYIYQEQLFFRVHENKAYINECVVTVSYLREDLYEEAIKIQSQVDAGKQIWRLSPKSLALQFLRNDLGIKAGEIINLSDNDVVFKKDNGEEIKIQLYRPVNINNGFLAVYQYSIGTTHYVMYNRYIAPQY